MDDAGYEGRIKGGKYVILRADGSTVCEGMKVNGTYRLNGIIEYTSASSGSEAVMAATATTTGAAAAAPMVTWHRRLGHANVPNPCTSCLAGKQIRTTMVSSDGSNRATEVLGRVHVDLVGPMEVESIGGAKYAAALVDDAARHVWTFFLRQKGDFSKQFKQWLTVIETKTGKKLKAFRLIAASQSSGRHRGRRSKTAWRSE